MDACWSGDGNEAMFLSVYDPMVTNEGEYRPRCKDCCDVISGFANGNSDDLVKKLLNLKVRKSGKLSTALTKMLESEGVSK